jgi:hypothetical protein
LKLLKKKRKKTLSKNNKKVQILKSAIKEEDEEEETVLNNDQSNIMQNKINIPENIFIPQNNQNQVEHQFNNILYNNMTSQFNNANFIQNWQNINNYQNMMQNNLMSNLRIFSNPFQLSQPQIEGLISSNNRSRSTTNTTLVDSTLDVQMNQLISHLLENNNTGVSNCKQELETQLNILNKLLQFTQTKLDICNNKKKESNDNLPVVDIINKSENVEVIKPISTYSYAQNNNEMLNNMNSFLQKKSSNSGEFFNL